PPATRVSRDFPLATAAPSAAGVVRPALDTRHGRFAQPGRQTKGAEDMPTEDPKGDDVYQPDAPDDSEVPDHEGIRDAEDTLVDLPGGTGEPRDDEVGDGRAGRLVAPDEGAHADEEKDLLAQDVGIDGAAASAEEAAVHVVANPESSTEPPDRTWSREPPPGS